MSEEDKESRKVADRAPARRSNIFKNEVAADNIRKEANFLESLSRRSWPDKYEHLTGRFFNEVLAGECREAGLPVDTFARDPPKDVVIHLSIPLRPSPPAPKTTSAQIGHRSSRPEYNLEFTGRLYVSPKSTMEPPAADTAELPRVTQQRFILLG